MAVWAELVQQEELSNEAKVEGFRPWEHLGFTVILHCVIPILDGLIHVSHLTGMGFESCGCWGGGVTFRCSPTMQSCP